MSQFCTQCGTENVNDAKFCKSCGHSLIEKEPSPSPEPTVIQTEPTQEQEAAVNAENTVSVENSTEVPTSLSGWLLLIPVIAWVLYRLAILASGNIVLMFVFMTVPNILAEALGGAIAIVGAPLIVTGLIYGVKKANGVQYTNFVKHTLIASIVLLAFGIFANINTIRDEQKAVLEQTTSAVVDPSAPAAEEAPPAAEAAAPVAEEAPAVLSEIEQAEQDCNHGNVDACYYLGKIYDTYYDIRDGVKKDNNQAVKFYKKACNGGNADACVSLGSMYGSGEGLKIDGDQVVKFYKKGCDGGRADACQILGTFYDGGRIIDYKVVAEDDKSKAIRFYKKACDGGDADGCSGYEELQSQGY